MNKWMLSASKIVSGYKVHMGLNSIGFDITAKIDEFVVWEDVSGNIFYEGKQKPRDCVLSGLIWEAVEEDEFYSAFEPLDADEIEMIERWEL